MDGQGEQVRGFTPQLLAMTAKDFRCGEFGPANLAAERAARPFGELHGIAVDERHTTRIGYQYVPFLKVADDRIYLVHGFDCETEVSGHIQQELPRCLPWPLWPAGMRTH